MRKAAKILSIDFDFFVTCPGLAVFSGDTSHWKKWQAEGKDLEVCFPFSKIPSFSELLQTFDFTETPFFDVGANHDQIVPLLPKGVSLEILNIDAHHDILYGTRAHKEILEEKKYDCGSWGAFLMESYRVGSWVQFYPLWRKTQKEEEITSKWLADNRGAKIEFRYYPDKLPKFKPDVVFLCRSVAWAPPCYDKEFEELRQTICRLGGFDPNSSV